MKLGKPSQWLYFFVGFSVLEFIYCEVHCKSPPAIQHGAVRGIKSGDNYLPYDEVEIRCEPGYKYSATTEFLMCEEDGKWEEDFAACVEIFCDPPEPPDNGEIPELLKSNLTLFPYNFEITYECSQGYQIFGGDSWRFCGKNGWSGNTPYCKEIRCPDPGVPEYGDREANNFQVGSKVRFRCFTGYNLLGSFERFCMPNGQWTGELTRCDNPGNYCPNPGIPINGFKNGASYDIGDKVSYRCLPGYMLLGSEVRECLTNRTWSGNEAKCMASYDFDNYAQMSEILKFKVTEKFGDENKRRKSEAKMETFIVTNGDIVGCPPSAKNCIHSHDSLVDSFQINIFKPLADRSLMNRGEHQSVERNLMLSPGTINLNHQQRLILHFAFDVSGSIGPHYLKKSIEFAKAIVKKVGISRYGSRASAIVFSSKSDTVFNSMQIETEEEVLRHLDNISFTGGGTSASSALALIKANIGLEDNYYDIKDKKDVVFIITDGKINMGGNPEMEAKALKDRNIDIYCIGITGDPRIETLYKIASKSKYGNAERENVFILKNYATLSHLINEITNGTLDFSKCGLGLENIDSVNQDITQNKEKKNEPWPWMAALYFLLPGASRTYQVQCGGTILKQNFILTAAHCLYFKDKKKMIMQRRKKEEILVKIERRNNIRHQYQLTPTEKLPRTLPARYGPEYILGLLNLKDETRVQEFGVKRIFIHEKYHPGNYSVQLYDYDIALLEIDGSIEYSRRIRPICLPPKDLPENSPLYSSNEFGWTGGWGHSGILNPFNPFTSSVQLVNSPKLKELRLPIQSNERCIKSLEDKNIESKYFTDRMLCSGNGKSGEDTCLGDSGGPLMQSQMNAEGFLFWTQVGIVSWGIGCGMENMYGYYTHVQKFRPWIDEIINAGDK